MNVAGSVVVEKGGKRFACYTPLPHQRRFHESEKPNCLMEGGAGSGKSLAIRWDAYARCLAIPRFHALILRRSMPELRKSHLREVPFEAEKLGLGKDAWHSTHFILRFPNGSTVTFGHVEDDQTVARYLSSEFDAIYFDELATFTLKQFMFLSSRARTTKPGLTAIVRGGTNPIGVGASWVKRYFITKDVSEHENPGYKASDYESIHSTIDDNPYVDVDDYGARLLSLPSEAMRKAMRYGEWVIEGQFWSDWRESLPDGSPWHVREVLPTWKGRPIIEAPGIEIVRVIDWGYAAEGNPGMCLWFVCLYDGSAIGFKEYVFKETLPKDAAAKIIEMSEGMTVRYTVADTAMWAEHEGPSIASHFEKAGIGMIEADKEREAGWIECHNWLRTVVTNGDKMWPKLSFLRSGCPVTIRTMPEMTVDPKNPADMITAGVEDEGSDNMRYFVMSRPARSREKVPDPSMAWIWKEIAKKRAAAGRLDLGGMRHG